MSPADGESEEQQLLSERTGDASMSSQPDTPTLASTTQTPSRPSTPSAASIPRIAETSLTAESPGSIGSSSEISNSFLSENNIGSSRDIHNTPRCSIPGGERGMNTSQSQCLIVFKILSQIELIVLLNVIRS